jgi:hypothetical protein
VRRAAEQHAGADQRSDVSTRTPGRPRHSEDRRWRGFAATNSAIINSAELMGIERR